MLILARLLGTSTFALTLTLAAGTPFHARAASPSTVADVVARATPQDWRPLDPNNTLYLELPSGRVVIELAPAFAPRHVGNIRALAKAGYWNGLAILRAQDNYVVQWGDPDAGSSARARPLENAARALPAEFARADEGLPFAKLADGDPYAPEAGWSDSFPVGRDPATGRAWLAHCYGMVGAGRDDPADSSNGSELYAVIGHAPRHLDRNITLVGRVVQGIERLSTLPRGAGELGFYERPAQRTTIRAVTLAADVPEAQRERLEVFRSDTPAFAQLVEARRNRREPWFIHPAGHIELCNVPIPVRVAPPVPSTGR